MVFDMDESGHDERGQVGISFLIVFIALVLVAAIAAGLFIQTAGVLEERASNTGEEATDEVSNQLKVTSKYGTVSHVDVDGDGVADTYLIDHVDLTVQRAAGAGDIDLSAATIDYKNTETQAFLQYATSGSETDGDNFVVTGVNDADGTAPVLTRDDNVFTVTLHLAWESNQDLQGGEEATVTINTANGGERTVVLEAPMQIPNNAGATVEL